MNVGDIRKAISGVPDNTFVNITYSGAPLEISAIFPLRIEFEPLPEDAGPHCTTSEGQKVIGHVDIFVEVSDATWGHECREIIMKHIEKARKKAKKELIKKGLD